MFRLFNKKGQEEAPFELLIAVIVMGFVLLIGIQAMAQLRTQKCNNETISGLEELKTKIEIVISQKSPQLVDFKPAECYNPADEKIKITQENNSRLCSSYCSSGASICTLLEYSNQKAGLSYKTCMSINPNTVFHSQTEPGQCPIEDKQILVDLKDIVPRGTYRIVQKITSDSFPHICAYCREGSGNCG